MLLEDDEIKEVSCTGRREVAKYMEAHVQGSGLQLSEHMCAVHARRIIHVSQYRNGTILQHTLIFVWKVRYSTMNGNF